MISMASMGPRENEDQFKFLCMPYKEGLLQLPYTSDKMIDDFRFSGCHGNEFFTLLSQKNGIPVHTMGAVYASKHLEIGKRLSDYGVQSESNLYFIPWLLDDSSQDSSIPPGQVLDDAVELCDAPDMITWDDDPENKRAKIPCGHAKTPKSLTAYCRSILDASHSRFLCPYISEDQPPVYCGVEWNYVDVRRLAVLTEEEVAEFEKKVSKNYLIKAMGIQQCPKCNSLVERINKKDIRVVCPLCTKNEKAQYEFC
ncbi:uncharacterized protein [Montipora capricornis]|uniref:uncharacterized protein isoform X3 n=1 Tax=Montipora capricornis TaxID=246305 RepID=UPI0035F19819